jgi:putative membrane protein
VTQQPEKPGLQAERTQLSWERTALVFLASGAIPLVGRSGPLAVTGPVLAVAGALLACLVVWLGRRRARHIMDTPRAEVLLLGYATAAFAAAVVVFLLL